jgi:hypothetical protein
MYEIFAPLDDKEPLPRELLLEARRYKRLGRRELAGALWLPALVVVTLVESWMQVPTLVAAALVGLLLIGFVVFAFSGERKPRLK